jgi:hypothetical protein
MLFARYDLSHISTKGWARKPNTAKQTYFLFIYSPMILWLLRKKNQNFRLCCLVCQKKTVRSIAKNPEVVNPNRYLTQSPWI